MTESQILATTYYDTMTVYRPYKAVLSDTGETVFYKGLNGEVVYENIPCALSSFTGGKINRNSVNVDVTSDYTLFYDPSYQIEKNDTIKCISCNRTFILSAGKERAFISHCELPVNEIEDKA